MIILNLLSYIAYTGVFVFVALSLVQGLLTLADTIEEHSIAAKAFGRRLVFTIMAILVALNLIDGLPLGLTLLGLVCHMSYLRNLGHLWPCVSFTSGPFLVSCVLVVVDHFCNYMYFKGQRQMLQNSRGIYSYPYYGNKPPSFFQITTYFGVCVWLVPFFLFLSLSANDNVLPSSMTADAQDYFKQDYGNANEADGAATPGLGDASAFAYAAPPTTFGHPRQHATRQSLARSAVNTLFDYAGAPFARPSEAKVEYTDGTSGDQSLTDIETSPSQYAARKNTALSRQPSTDGLNGADTLQRRRRSNSNLNGAFAATPARPPSSDAQGLKTPTLTSFGPRPGASSTPQQPLGPPLVLRDNRERPSFSRASSRPGSNAGLGVHIPGDSAYSGSHPRRQSISSTPQPYSKAYAHTQTANAAATMAPSGSSGPTPGIGTGTGSQPYAPPASQNSAPFGLHRPVHPHAPFNAVAQPKYAQTQGRPQAQGAFPRAGERQVRSPRPSEASPTLGGAGGFQSPGLDSPGQRRL